jgi:hypothetical protein
MITVHNRLVLDVTSPVCVLYGEHREVATVVVASVSAVLDVNGHLSRARRLTLKLLL